MTDPSKADTVEVRRLKPRLMSLSEITAAGLPKLATSVQMVRRAYWYERLWRQVKSWLRRLLGRWWLWWLVGFVTGASLILAVIPGRLL